MEIFFFLIILFTSFVIAIVYTINSVNNYQKYTYKGSRTQGKLIYSTKYNTEDCLGLLSRKNLYDVFNYTFKNMSDKESSEIILTGCNKHHCGSIRTVYLMRFIKYDNGTLIEMVFQNELYVSPIPCIPEYWVDEFLFQKLEAIRVG